LGKRRESKINKLLLATQIGTLEKEEEDYRRGNVQDLAESAQWEHHVKVYMLKGCPL
jgi:hypothetical protein